MVRRGGEDGVGQGGVQLGRGQLRPGHQVEQGRGRRQARDQLSVRLGGRGHEQVGDRARDDVPPVRAEREGAEQHGRQRQGLVRRGRRVHHRAGHRRHRQTGRGDRHGPADRPLRTVPLLGRAGRQQVVRQPAAGRPHHPARRVSPVPQHHHPARRLRTGQQAAAGVDRAQRRQGQQQHRVQSGQSRRPDRVDRVRAQRQPDLGVPVPRRQRLGRPRQPQHRHLARPPAQLGRQRRHLRDQHPGLRGREPDAARRRVHRRRVRHRQHGREPDPEPPDAVPVPLGRRPQRGQRLRPGRVQRRARVGRGQ